MYIFLSLQGFFVWFRWIKDHCTCNNAWRPFLVSWPTTLGYGWVDCTAINFANDIKNVFVQVKKNVMHDGALPHSSAWLSRWMTHAENLDKSKFDTKDEQSSLNEYEWIYNVSNESEFKMLSFSDSSCVISVLGFETFGIEIESRFNF